MADRVASDDAGPLPIHVSTGFDAQDRTVVLGRQDIKEAVRPLPYVANPLMQFGQHRLTTKLLPLLVEDNPLNLACSGNSTLTESGDEHVASPEGKRRARVERHASDGDR